MQRGILLRRSACLGKSRTGRIHDRNTGIKSRRKGKRAGSCQRGSQKFCFFHLKTASFNY